MVAAMKHKLSGTSSCLLANRMSAILGFKPKADQLLP